MWKSPARLVLLFGFLLMPQVPLSLKSLAFAEATEGAVTTSADRGAKFPDSAVASSSRSGNLSPNMTSKAPVHAVSTSGFQFKFPSTLAPGSDESPPFHVPTLAPKSGTLVLDKLSTPVAQPFTKATNGGVNPVSQSGTGGHFSEFSSNLARIDGQTSPLNSPTVLGQAFTEPADGMVMSTYRTSPPYTLRPTPVMRSNTTQSKALPSQKIVLPATTLARPTVPHNQTSQGADTRRLGLVSYSGVGVAIVSLFVTLLSLVCLRFKKTEHHFIHANFVTSLLFAQALFLFGVQRLEYKMACQLIAVALHYLYLVAFCWVALEGVMLFLLLAKGIQTNIPLKRRRTVFFLCGWGIPMAFVGATVALFYEEYGQEDFCWLSVYSDVLWALVGPVLFVCLLNFLCLMKTFCVMAERRRLNQNQDRVAEIRFWAKGCAVLSCLLAISWMLGVFVVNESTPFMVYLFNAFNTLQGVLIFILYCLGDDRIRAEYTSMFHCSKKRATYGLVRQQSKTDTTTPNKADPEACPVEPEAQMKTVPGVEQPQDTLGNTASQAVARRPSPKGSPSNRASRATSGEYKRVSQDVGSAKRQSREWACSWTPVEEDPEGSFAMDVFSTLKAGDGYRDLPVVDSGAAHDQGFAFPPPRNEFKSFKVSCAKKQEDASHGWDSRVLKLYEDERPTTAEAVS